MSTSDGAFDIGIVGYGPVGATLANLLGVSGLSVAIFEREAAPYDLPRAVHFDDEVMRVFQTLGLSEALLSKVIVNQGMRFVTAAGATLMDWPRPQEVTPQGWHSSYRFHQPDLEDILRAGVERFPNQRVQLSTDVLAATEAGDRVVVHSRDRQTGREATTSCRYLVGCDGARSPVRDWIGAGLEDLGCDQQWLVVDVLMHQPRPDLSQWTLQYCDPARPTTAARGVGLRRRWEFMVMPQDDQSALTSAGNIWSLLAPWLTSDEAVIERAALYRFNARVADGWRKGRMMLAGDACHQTPPFLGQGLCAGIRDAANLAWKLDAVVHGADDRLLESYEVERRPHVRDFVALAVEVGGLLQTTDPQEAERRDRQFADQPKTLQSITPRLGPGLQRDAPAPAGTLFPQPYVGTGVRMDDMVGYGFALAVTPSALAQLSPEQLAWLRRIKVTVVVEGVGPALEGLKACAAILRPDRYILGVAPRPENLETMLSSLGEIFSRDFEAA